MKFIELSKEEYRSFVSNHEQANFLNSYEFIEMKKKEGFETALVGVKEGEQVIAAASLMFMSVKRIFKYAYSPRGLVVDYRNKVVLSFFMTQLKNYLKAKKIVYLTFDPYVRYIERDRFGNEVEGGYHNEDILENLKEVGAIHQGFSTGFSTSQARWMYQIDLPYENEIELLKSFERNAKREVENAIKNKVTLRKLERDELVNFHALLQETEKRKGFAGRDLKYYLDCYDAFNDAGMISFRCAELHVKEALDAQRDSIDKLKKEIEEMRNKNENLSKKQLNKIKEKENQLNKSLKIEEKISDILNTKGEIITLSAGMWFEYAHEYLCLISGVFEEYMSFSGPHFMHYEMMREILHREGFERYNFYGISGDFDPKAEDYGVLAFKQSFGGYVEELIGDFHLVINPMKYKLIHTL